MILILLELMVALLAGLGLYTLINLEEKKKSQLQQKVLYATLALGGLFLIVLLFKGATSSAFAGALADSPKSHPQLNPLRVDMFYSGLIKGLFIGTLALGLIWAYLTNKVKGLVLSLGMLGLMLIELGPVDYRFTSKAVPASRVRSAEQETPAIKKLKALTQANPGRIFPVHSLFGSNVWALYGLESIGGYSPAKLKVLQDWLNSTDLEQSFLLKYYAQTASGATQKPIEEVNPGLRKRHLDVLRNMNVKYLVSPYPLNDPLFKLVEQSYHISRGQRVQVQIYEFTDDFPRAWFVTNIQVATSSEAVSSRLDNLRESPREVAVVLDPEGQLSKQDYIAGEVTVTGKSIHSLKLATQNEGEGFLVVSDVYYPAGWSVYLDGETRLHTYATNELIRGIVVPAGQHEIEFVYEPSAVRTGFMITLMSLFLVIGLGAFLIYKSKMSPSEA